MFFLRYSFWQRDYLAYLLNRIFITLLVALLVMGSVDALAENYNFTVVATDGDIIDGHLLVLNQQSSLSLPAINDSGEVVFTATFQGGRGIFTDNSAILIEGDTVAGHVLTSISGNPDINTNGTVVYRGGFSGGYGIFTQGENLFSTGQIVGNLEITAFPQSTLTINDSGNVAVMVRGVDVNTAELKAHVIDRSGTIAAPGDIIDGKTITDISQNPFAFVSINNSGEISFQAAFDGKKGIFSRTSFLTGEGEIVEGYVINDLAAQTVVDGSGNVVFIGVFCNTLYCPDPVRAAVMTQDQLLVTNGQLVGGEEITGFQVSASPAVSESGRLVFSGSSIESQPGGGLYTPDGPVIRYPATISGRPVNHYEIGPSGINDSGQVAFITRFEDTRKWAVIRADPVDQDGDGVPDHDDACPDSDLSHTVVIDGCESGVVNALDADGCTISDKIAECANEPKNHGKYVSCVALTSNDLKNDGVIREWEKGAIEKCSAQVDLL